MGFYERPFTAGLGIKNTGGKTRGFLNPEYGYLMLRIQQIFMYKPVLQVPQHPFARAKKSADTLRGWKVVHKMHKKGGVYAASRLIISSTQTAYLSASARSSSGGIPRMVEISFTQCDTVVRSRFMMSAMRLMVYPAASRA